MQWPRWSEIVLAAVALAVALWVGTLTGHTGTPVSSGHLNVTASGQVQVAPDEAQINLGSNVTAGTAAEALAKLSAISERLVAAVHGYSIPAGDVQASGLNVGQYFGQNGQPQGYQASETFTVTLHKLPVIGKVVAAATTAGANQVNGITFLSSDPNAGMQAAVAKALAAAKRQARSEASELGVTLGSVTLVKLDQSPSSPIPFAANYHAAAAAVDSALLPVPPGNETVSAQVTVTYSFH